MAEFAFGEVCARSGLARRERQSATLASLATQDSAPLQRKIHIQVAFHLRLSQREIVEVFLQLGPYAGFAAAIKGVAAAGEVFAVVDKET